MKNKLMNKLHDLGFELEKSLKDDKFSFNKNVARAIENWFAKEMKNLSLETP